MAEIQQTAREDLSKIELKNTTQSQQSCCNRQVVYSYLAAAVLGDHTLVQVALTATFLQIYKAQL